MAVPLFSICIPTFNDERFIVGATKKCVITNRDKLIDEGLRMHKLFSDLTSEKICTQLYEKINLLLNNYTY